MAKVAEATLNIVAKLVDEQARSALKSLSVEADNIEKKLNTMKINLSPNNVKSGIKAAEKNLLKDGGKKMNQILSDPKYSDPKKIEEQYGKVIAKKEKETADLKKSYDAERQAFYSARDSLSDLYTDAKIDGNPQALARLRKGAKNIQTHLNKFNEKTLMNAGLYTQEDKDAGLSRFDAFMNKMGTGTRNKNVKSLKFDEIMEMTDSAKDLRVIGAQEKLAPLANNVTQAVNFAKEIQKQGRSLGSVKSKWSDWQKTIEKDNPAEIVKNITEMQALQRASFGRMSDSDKQKFISSNQDWYNQRKNILEGKATETGGGGGIGEDKPIKITADISQAQQALATLRGEFQSLRSEMERPIKVTVDKDGINKEGIKGKQEPSKPDKSEKSFDELATTKTTEKPTSKTKNAMKEYSVAAQEAIMQRVRAVFSDSDLYDSVDLKSTSKKLTGNVAKLLDDGSWGNVKLNIPLQDLAGKSFTADDVIGAKGNGIGDLNIKTQLKQAERTMKQINKLYSGFNFEKFGNTKFGAGETASTFAVEMDRVKAAALEIQSQLANGLIPPSGIASNIEQMSSLVSEMQTLSSMAAEMTNIEQHGAFGKRVYDSDDILNAHKILRQAMKADGGQNFQETQTGLKVHADGLVRGTVYQKRQGEWFEERIAKPFQDLLDETNSVADLGKLDPIFNIANAQRANSLTSVQKTIDQYKALKNDMRSGVEGTDFLGQLADINIKVTGEDRIVSVREQAENLIRTLDQLTSKFGGDINAISPDQFQKYIGQYKDTYKELQGIFNNKDYQKSNSNGTLIQNDLIKNLKNMSTLESSDALIHTLKDQYRQQGKTRVNYKLMDYDKVKGKARISSNDGEYNYVDTVSIQDTVNALGQQEQAIRVASKAESEYVSIGQQFVGSFKNKLKSIRDYVASITLITGAIGQVRQGFQSVVQIDSALSNISMTMNATGNQLRNIRDQSIELGQKLGTNAQNVLSAVSIYANANETAESIMAKATPTIMLSNASGQSAEVASTQLQSVIQQFEGMEGQEDRIVNAYEKISAGIAMDFSQGIGVIAEGNENRPNA